MSKTLKWIIGIILALVVVCGIAALTFLAFNPIRGSAWVMGAHMPRYWDGGRFNPGRELPWDDMPMRPNGFMRGYFPFGGLVRGLFGLGFLFLIGLAVVALVIALTRSRKPAAAVASPAPVTPLAEQVQAAVPARYCPNCQHAVEEGWSHCPYCGTALTPPE